MNPAEIRRIRNRSVHFLSEEVAQYAGMTLDQLKQLSIGHYTPSDDQLRQLARRMRLDERTAS
ncbi:hypothetical protein [Bradyrhizobium sp. 604_D8_N2_3]|uniref:hypothetical protein n=1 Tax=Bradyrhizobium sp. 604_D8_N2_3 TaxID=3240370 RepID=UPI003F2086FF